jgi:hypothetical protein
MAVVKKAKRQYLTISEIQDEYLPISKKKIRILVKKYLPARMLGNRIFVDRAKLEELLSSEDGQRLDLN